MADAVLSGYLQEAYRLTPDSQQVAASGALLVSDVQHTATCSDDTRSTGREDSGPQIGVVQPRPRTARGGSFEENPKKNARVAAIKAISILLKMERQGYLGVEQASVYGAAVAVPQIARSAGWTKPLRALTVRTYCFLVINFLIQGFLVCVLSEEEKVMNGYSGMMHLCDFGATLESCPGHPGCEGPGGTEITGRRLYDYDLWSTRSFVRDSLTSLFPEKAEEIQKTADPGEYGLENYYCRLVCCFLFMMDVVDDLRASIELGYLLFLIPSEKGLWIKYQSPEWADKDAAKKIHGWSELDLVKFRIQGMPLSWKIANLLFIFIPKVILWYAVTSVGFRFLMETAGIVDLVVNAMALGFVLGIDEMIIERFGSLATKHMMDNLEAFPMFDTSEEESETLDQAYQRELREERESSYAMLFCSLVPRRLIFVCVLMVYFELKYYYVNCQRTEDGTWVSSSMYIPQKVVWDPLSLLRYGHTADAKPFWTWQPSNSHEEP